MRKLFFSSVLYLVLAACAAEPNSTIPRTADAVTEWTFLADDYGRGNANWRTLAIMHMAMHDALNAAHPVYARWASAGPDEPPAADAVPEVAMAAAAHQVLLKTNPDRLAETNQVYQAAIARFADSPGKKAGIRLGTAIGDETVLHRAKDGSRQVHNFAAGDAPGKWRPTPEDFATSPTNNSVPFLFASRSDVPGQPPPVPGSPEYLTQLAQTRSLGALHSTERTAEQTFSAKFWASQSSQRGFVHLATILIQKYPRPRGIYDSARIMAQLTTALADSAILTWGEKEQYSFWRPVSAIRLANSASPADHAWLPLIETPPFPEYPSGHAADCYTGAGVLEAGFPDVHDPIVYVAWRAWSGAPQPAAQSFGMGQHAQENSSPGDQMVFPSLAAAAENCSQSRIWAGAHLLAADEEAHRLADTIVQRATTAVPLTANAFRTTRQKILAMQ